MTLPNQFSFPELPSEDEPEKIYQYLKEQRFELNQMYEQMTFNINGSIRSYAETGADSWTPTLSGRTTEGVFTYTNQVGWTLRQGILTEIWFYLRWTASTGTGFLNLDLPYKVTGSANNPFIGSVYSSGITYPTGMALVISAGPDSYIGSFISYGSAVNASVLSVPSSGTLVGSVRYIGVEDE